MRELIQPTLKIVARTGLFLAVVAWVATQWWTFALNIRPVCVEIEADGFAVSVSSSVVAAFIEPGVFVWQRETDNTIDSNARRWTSTIDWQVWPGRTYELMIHHWLVVAVFVVFHVALSFIYRNPARESAMRELIKPGLFWVMRLGLLFAILAWVVGQWFSLSILVPLPIGMAGAELCPDSWHYRQTSRRLSVRVFNLVRTSRSSAGTVFLHTQFELQSQIEHNRWMNLTFGDRLFFTGNPYASTVRYDSANKRDFKQIPHWLIVTIFAAFYATLKWVYRKRAGEVVGDE